MTVKSVIKGGQSTCSSFGILTWMQVQADEKREVLFPVLQELYKEKKKLRNDKEFSDIEFTDMHDQKMSYLLTQHSLWNRKVNPFIACHCKRGEGVQRNNDPNFICKDVTDEEHVSYYERSEKRLERKKARLGPNEIYTSKHHRDWCDEHNLGITHYGINPKHLPVSSIRYDVMHMGMALNRSNITYTRKFVLSQEQAFIDTFNNHLRTFWGEYHLFVWNNDKPFSSFHGNELKLWTKNIPKTVAVIRENFETTEQVANLCLLLTTFAKLPDFWNMTEIENESDYPQLIVEYETNAKILYDVGAKTVLTNNTKGDCETIYYHVARYYIPKIARKLFEMYGLGVGVFNMQGFERRNKESKNTLKRFCNHKGNIVLPNLKRIWDIFYNSKNAY